MIYLVHELLELHSKNNPNQTFIQQADTRLSYSHVDRVTSEFSNVLQSRRIQRYDAVIVLLPRSIESILCLFSILKSDATYVALNPALPSDKLRHILEETSAKLIITNKNHYLSKHTAIVSALNIEILYVEDEFDSDYNYLTRNNPCQMPIKQRAINKYQNIDSDLAYILYTSGSTGNPKGVMITHRSILDYVYSISDILTLSKNDVFGNTSGVYFDLSVFDIYVSLYFGATIDLIPDEVLKFPINLFNYVHSQQITIMNSVPSFLSYLSSFLDSVSNKFDKIHHFVFCGEVMPIPVIKTWISIFPNKKFINFYGPTEATCESMYFEIDSNKIDCNKSLPIGKPLKNTEIYILDENMNPVEKGAVGELFLRGVSNSVGYFNNLEENKRKFRQNPFNKFYNELIYATGDLVKQDEDGLIYFVGRNDNQVKILGYRIEIEEVERVLLNISNVIEAAVVINNNSDSVKQHYLTAIIYSKKELDIKKLSTELSLKLLPYMIPKKFEICNYPLPKNANGKIDRKKIKEMYVDDTN